jgi:Hint module
MIVEAGESRKQDTIAGLVSFGGTGCFLFPAVFTRVSAYKDWIVQQACQGSNALPDWCSNGVGNNVIPATPSPVIRPSTPRPTRAPSLPIGSPGCFAASTTVEVFGGGSIPMKDLVQGDLVLTENGKYEPIYTFGHYAPAAIATFLDVRTAITTLRLTKHHMVYINQQGQPIAASQLSVGDLLRTVASEIGEPILSIREVREKGLYAPFTPSGKIVVNGIIASVYMTVLNENTVDLGWIHISPHWMSHSILFPH